METSNLGSQAPEQQDLEPQSNVNQPTTVNQPMDQSNQIINQKPVSQDQSSGSLSGPVKILVDTLKFYKENFLMIIKIFSLPLILYIAQIFMPQSIIYLLWSILTSLITYISILVFIYFTIHYQESLSLVDCYKKSLKYFWSNAWIAILEFFILFGGFTLLIIPGIILAIRLTFTQYILFDQEKRGLSALVASCYYVKNRWWAILWRVLFYSLLCILVVSIVAGLLFVIDYFITGSFSSEGSTLSTGIMEVINMIVLVPISLIYTFVMYKELKSIKSQEELAGEQTKSKNALMAYSIFGLVANIVMVIVTVVFIGIVGVWLSGLGDINKTNDNLTEQTTETANVNNTTNSYTNDKYKFTFQYSNDLTIQSDSTDEYINLAPGTGEHWVSSFTITPNNSNLSLDELYNQSYGDVTTLFDASDEISVTDILINGVKAKKIVATNIGDYGNTTIMMLLNNNLIMVAGDSSDKGFEALYNSIKSI